MKANELMIGDWVQHKGKPIQVEEILDYAINPDWAGAEIDSEIILEDISPIPLTPEILEKNGWSLWEIEGEYRCAGASTLYGTKAPFSVFDNICINFVHELQHALRLCGIEKTIEL